jgi:hypothetical protein
MKGRIYDPLVGQFLTADPMMANPVGGQGLNRFAYVENSPLNYTDPTGFFLTPLAKVGIAVGIGYAVCSPGADPLVSRVRVQTFGKFEHLEIR